MKKLLPLLAVFLLTAAFAATTVTKTVGGPTLLDFGDKLSVNLSLSGDKLLTLRDPVPAQFSVVDAPALCSVTAQLLTCDLKGADVRSVSYTLVALSMGERVLFDRAMLDYESGGVTATTVSNDVKQIYQVGLPQLNATSVSLTVNGELSSTVLPNGEVFLLVGLKNEGATEAKSASAEITYPSDWTLVGESSAGFASVKPAETVTASYSFLAPQVDKLTIGDVSLSLRLSWYDTMRNSTGEKTEVLTVTQAKPQVEISRAAYFEWQKKGELLDANASLEPFVFMVYTMENKGNEVGYVSLEQSLPMLSEVNGEWSNPLALTLNAGEKVTRKISGRADVATVSIPPASATVKDKLENAYPSFTFQQENVVIGSTIWSTIFIMTKSYFPKIQIAAIILTFLLAGYVWRAKGFLRLAVVAALLLCLALLYSTYTVLF